MTARVVIIGAGIGGLSAALRLAGAGHAVMVLEAAVAPGGKMRSLPSPAGPVDAGPTVLTLRGHFDTLFARIGERFADHVSLIPEPLLARHFWPDGTSLDLCADRAANRRAISAFAGAGAAAEFDRFSDRAERLYAAFEGPVMRAPAPDPWQLVRQSLAGGPALLAAMAPHRNLAQTLRRCFSDTRLAQLFGRYATYVGGSPSAAPSLLALIWQAEASGVWRIEGGMHRLAEAMAMLATSKGAEFRYEARVARIERQEGRARAVVLEDGTRLPAAAVIFNGDPAALASGLLGPAVTGVPRGATEPRSLSARVWAFAARTEGPPLAHHNVFFAADPRAEFDDLAAGRMPADPTIYVCAQDRGTGCTPPPTERFEIILNAAPLCPASPPDEKEAETCRELTLATLARFGLRFTPEPSESALTTPTDFAALFPGSAGSLYGRSPHGLMAAFRRPTVRGPIPGLYLAGGGVHPGPGVPMAALSGLHAAEAILNDPASISMSRSTAMPGGISTRLPRTAGMRFRSSVS